MLKNVYSTIFHIYLIISITISTSIVSYHSQCQSCISVNFCKLFYTDTYSVDKVFVQVYSSNDASGKHCQSCEKDTQICQVTMSPSSSNRYYCWGRHALIFLLLKQKQQECNYLVTCLIPGNLYEICVNSDMQTNIKGPGYVRIAIQK